MQSALKEEICHDDELSKRFEGAEVTAKRVDITDPDINHVRSTLRRRTSSVGMVCDLKARGILDEALPKAVSAGWRPADQAQRARGALRLHHASWSRASLFPSNPQRPRLSPTATNRFHSDLRLHHARHSHSIGVGWKEPRPLSSACFRPPAPRKPGSKLIACRGEGMRQHTSAREAWADPEPGGGGRCPPAQLTQTGVAPPLFISLAGSRRRRSG